MHAMGRNLPVKYLNHNDTLLIKQCLCEHFLHGS